MPYAWNLEKGNKGTCSWCHTVPRLKNLTDISERGLRRLIPDLVVTRRAVRMLQKSKHKK